MGQIMQMRTAGPDHLNTDCDRPAFIEGGLSGMQSGRLMSCNCPQNVCGVVIINEEVSVTPLI